MLTYTIITTCALAFLHIALSIYIIKIRRTKLIGLGSGKSTELACGMRAQTNNLEYSFWFIALLALAEGQYGATPLLAILCSIFVSIRIWHAVSFIRSGGAKSYGRFVGTFMSISSLMTLIVINLLCLIK